MHLCNASKLQASIAFQMYEMGCARARMNSIISVCHLVVKANDAINLHRSRHHMQGRVRENVNQPLEP